MPTTFTLPPEIDKRLGAIAARTHRSKAYHIRDLIEQGLEDLEDYYAAEEVMKRIRSGECKLHDLDEVEKRLGLLDDQVI